MCVLVLQSLQHGLVLRSKEPEISLKIFNYIECKIPEKM
jgi:hypothetical protein